MAKAVDVAITLKEIAVYLKIVRSTVCKLAQEGRIPGQKVGRDWRFRRDSIDRWLNEGKPTAAPADEDR